MTPKQIAFLDKQTETNQEWAAKMMLDNLKPAERHMIGSALRKLDKLLYKSWAKDLCLTELIEAVEMTRAFEPKDKI